VTARRVESEENAVVSIAGRGFQAFQDTKGSTAMLEQAKAGDTEAIANALEVVLPKDREYVPVPGLSPVPYTIERDEVWLANFKERVRAFWNEENTNAEAV
jgi:hypothetical protein